jgi:hypothetical protein
MRLEAKAKEFPAEFPISSVEEIVTWDWVTAGEARQLLPVQADVLVVYAQERRAYLNRLQYRNHRHFQASSSIRFGK